MSTKLASPFFPPTMSSIYAARYGKIPASVGKFVGQTDQMPEFEALIKEQLAKDEPVTDWEEFVKPLLRPRGQAIDEEPELPAEKDSKPSSLDQEGQEWAESDRRMMELSKKNGLVVKEA